MIPHWVTDASAALAPFVGVAWLLMQLKTKDQIQEATSTITNKIGEIGTTLAAHVAGDEEKHRAIDYAIAAHDRRLDRVENKV